MDDIFYNKTVTIWNKSVDGLTEKETWTATKLENIRLIVSRGNNIQNSGNASADSARVHIKDDVSKSDKPFMEYNEWHKLVTEEKANYYTLEDKDSFFVEGDTTGIEWRNKNSFFEWMKKNYMNCFRISSVDRFEVIPHFEVWGK